MEHAAEVDFRVCGGMKSSSQRRGDLGAKEIAVVGGGFRLKVDRVSCAAVETDI